MIEMSQKEAYILPNHSGPTMAVGIDLDLCIGCNSCASICRTQTLIKNPEKGKPPVVAYPDECWYCGCCVEACPTGALQMRLPINQRVFFKDKDTGEVFRIGGAESPEKSFFKPPYGWLDNNETNLIWREIERGERTLSAYVSQSVCTELGKYLGDKEERDKGLKVSAMLRKLGFSKVYLSDDVKPEAGVCTVHIGPEPSKAEYNIDVKALANMIHHGCVSRYTAVHTWRSLGDQPFDSLD